MPQRTARTRRAPPRGGLRRHEAPRPPSGGTEGRFRSACRATRPGGTAWSSILHPKTWLFHRPAGRGRIRPNHARHGACIPDTVPPYRRERSGYPLERIRSPCPRLRRLRAFVHPVPGCLHADSPGPPVRQRPRGDHRAGREDARRLHGLRGAVLASAGPGLRPAGPQASHPLRHGDFRAHLAFFAPRPDPPAGGRGLSLRRGRPGLLLPVHDVVRRRRIPAPFSGEGVRLVYVLPLSRDGGRAVLACWTAPFFSTYAWGALFAFFPLYARNAGISVTHTGLIFTCQAAANAAIRIPVGHLAARTGKRERYIVAGNLFFALCIALIGAFRGAVPLYLLFFGIGGGMAGAFPAIGAGLSESVPPRVP